MKQKDHIVKLQSFIEKKHTYIIEDKAIVDQHIPIYFRISVYVKIAIVRCYLEYMFMFICNFE